MSREFLNEQTTGQRIYVNTFSQTLSLNLAHKSVVTRPILARPTVNFAEPISWCPPRGATRSTLDSGVISLFVSLCILCRIDVRGVVSWHCLLLGSAGTRALTTKCQCHIVNGRPRKGLPWQINSARHLRSQASALGPVLCDL